MESQATHLLHRHIFEPNFSLPRKASKFQSRLLLLNFKIPSSSQARDFSFPGFTASWANGARCIEAQRFPSKSHLKLTLSLQCHKTVKRRTQFTKNTNSTIGIYSWKAFIWVVTALVIRFHPSYRLFSRLRNYPTSQPNYFSWWFGIFLVLLSSNFWQIRICMFCRFSQLRLWQWKG